MPTGAGFEVTTVEKTKNYAIFAVVQKNNSSVTNTNSLLVDPPPVESPSINYFCLTENTFNSNLVNIPLLRTAYHEYCEKELLCV